MNTTTSSDRFKGVLRDILLIADIQINGTRAWDIQVHNPAFFKRVMKEHALGLGESYMDGWWDCENLDEFFFRILSNSLQTKIKYSASMVMQYFLTRLINIQSRKHLKEGVAVSYDKGIELYLSFLDPYNQYSCGYFKNTEDLTIAQEQKMDLICRKLYLTPEDRILDIGCGWGGLAKFICERIHCSLTGINISGQQLKFARELCREYDVEFYEMDYRDLKQEKYFKLFHKIVSVGMLEHVGYKNYRLFMEAAAHCMKEEGLFLLHTIGSDVSTTGTDLNPWLTKYIFPHSMTPSIEQLSAAAENLFVIEDVHNFGQYYDLTLMAWARNFEKNWEKLKHHYDERFHRMWRYYLLSCAGGFRARHNHLWQIVFTKKGSKREYISVR